MRRYILLGLFVFFAAIATTTQMVIAKDADPMRDQVQLTLELVESGQIAIAIEGLLTNSESARASEDYNIQLLEGVTSGAGRAESHEILSVYQLTPKHRVYYGVNYFTDNAIYWKFVSYKTEKSWKLITWQFNIDPTRILPVQAWQPID